MGSARIFLLLAAVALYCSLSKAAGVPVAYCGLSSDDPFSDRIVGGVESVPHEFPWMVKLKKRNSFYCGAALIADRYILTAGHCMCSYLNGSPREPKSIRGNIKNYKLYNIADISAEIGSHLTKDQGTVQRKVLDTIVHPDYDTFLSNGIMLQTNDIALLKISPVEFTPNVIPICLPSAGERVPDNSIVIVAGWGSTNSETFDNKNTLLPESLLKTGLHKISWDECRANPNVGVYLEPANELNDREIFCLIGNNTDACRGDSGGPAIVYTNSGFVVAGIVSWGIGCNQMNFPSAYTQVSSYIDFIKYHTKDAEYLPKMT